MSDDERVISDAEDVNEEENPLAMSKRYITTGFGKKDTRACMACGLIKQSKQFAQYGCENCPFLELQNNGNLDKFTTRNYAGTVALMDPEGSWVAKWNHIIGITGIYAIKLFGACPSELEELCLEARVPCKILMNSNEAEGASK